MYLVHPEHPPSGPEAQRFGNPPSDPQGDHFLSGAPIVRGRNIYLGQIDDRWLRLVDVGNLTTGAADIYISPIHMPMNVFGREVKKGSAELMILALLEDRQRHGYEIGKQIEVRSKGAITFQAASLYPMLYRLERRGWIEGRWVEKAGERRRRFYRLTAEGRQVLRHQRSFWSEFVDALDLVAGIRPASPKRGA